MLKNVDPVLTPELLYVLATMGHGDDLVLADANFPAASVAAETTHGKVIELSGVDSARAARAILSALPLDEHVATPAWRMAVTEAPEIPAPIQVLVQAEIDFAAGTSLPMEGLERFAFYEAARKAFAVVRTSELQFYGDFIFRKGAVRPVPVEAHSVDGGAVVTTDAASSP
jgi:L-fucose mutarotase